MTFKSRLEHIQEDLNKHKRDRSKLLASYIQVRLNKSLQTYYKEVSNSFSYLSDKNDTNLVKNMNKVLK